MLFLVACGARDPVAVCPPVAPGDLVVTELMGDEDLANGMWIELYNASAATLDLEGLRIRFRKKDGSGEIPVIVRTSLVVEPGGYTTLGRYTDDNLPPHVAYGFGAEFDAKWLDAAAVEVESCGERIDLAQYDALPEAGTLAFGPAPDADINDIPTEWCIDPEATGTPGAANPPCPAF